MIPFFIKITIRKQQQGVARIELNITDFFINTAAIPMNRNNNCAILIPEVTFPDIFADKR